MASLILIARATGRTYMILRALMIAGLIMLLINPYLLAFDTGFQLSFVATLGLILIAPLIEERLHLIPSTLQIREFFTATLATQIIVLPLLVFQIGQFSLIAVVVNVLVLPMVPIAMLLTFLSGMAAFVSATLGTLLGFLGFLSLFYITSIATFFGSLPFASVVISEFPFWIMVVLYVLMGLGIYKYSKRDETIILDDDGDDFSDWTIEEEIEGGPQEFPFR